MAITTKVWWMDDSDLLLVKSKLDAARQKYSDYDWVRFTDDSYANLDEAYKNLVNMICMRSPFSPGKIVYCYGLPLKKQAADFHTLLAKDLARIPENICFIIIARPDKGSSLYKATKALVEEKQAKLEEAFELTKTNAVDWIMAQASALKLTIDKHACMMLADLTDFSPAKIQNELLKFQSLVTDGMISVRIVAMAGFGHGTTDVKELAQFILKDDGDSAHEYLQRLLDRGEPPIKICGYLQDWITRLAIAQSAKCNFEAIRNDVAELRKWQKDDKKDSYESVYDEKWGHFSRWKGESAPMFANSNSLFYSCKELREANKPINWAYDALYRMGVLQEQLRKDAADEVKLMHRFISSLIRERK